MEANMSTFERRIEILFMIVRRKKVLLSELSEYFSVHINTIYNDISFLSLYAPIYTKTGVHGGAFIIEGYRNDLFLYLSYEEEQLLNRLMSKLAHEEQRIIRNILNKYSMPK